MKNYWQWRYARDVHELGRRYCEPKRTIGQFNEKVLHVKQLVSAFLDGNEFETVLDFGCGTGFLHDAFGKAEYLGVDIITELIDENIKKYGNKFELIGEVDCLWKSYDLIFSKATFQHLRDDVVRHWLREFRDHCNNLVIFSPVGSVDAEILLEGTEASAPTCRRPVELEAMVKGAGYRIIKSEGNSCFIWAIPDNESKPI